MASRAPRFRQADLTRALKAGRDAGMFVRVEIETDGRMVVIPQDGPAPGPVANEWDVVLK